MVILNASRSDTAQYRCEVAAIDDHKPFDEILISLAVRGNPPFGSLRLLTHTHTHSHSVL